MSDPEPIFLSSDLRVAELALGDTRRMQSARGLRLRVGDTWIPIRRIDDVGFELDIAFAPKLRGRVEVHDSRGLVRTGLVVAAAPSDGGVRYEFKRTSRPLSAPPRDYMGAEPWDGASPG